MNYNWLVYRINSNGVYKLKLFYSTWNNSTHI